MLAVWRWRGKTPMAGDERYNLTTFFSYSFLYTTREETNTVSLQEEHTNAG